MNNDLDYVESDYDDKRNQLPWLKIGVILVGLILLVVLVFSLLKGCSDKEYKVIFDSAGGSTINEQILESGEVVVRPVNPTRIGYTFIGWYHNDEIFNFNEEIKNDITLVAKWEEVLISQLYIVNFDSAGGSYVEPQQVEMNKTVIRPTDPEKEGYVFQGWYIDEITEFDFTLPITMDINLIAKWITVENDNGSSSGGTQNKTQYTVTFDTDGGSSISSKTITKGEKVIRPSNPTKNNYTFQGWYLNGKVYDFNSVVNGNITLKAVWKENEKYTVTFNSDGGSSVASKQVYKNEKVNKPSDPTKTYYTFKGWYLDGKLYDFATKITKNITLVAKWESNYSFNVSINNSSISISNINLPSGYTIKYKKGNVSINDVISSGTKINISKNSIGNFTINSSDYYTIVASVGSKEVLTKTIYAYKVNANSEKDSTHTVKLPSNIKGIDTILKSNATANAVISNSQLKITATGTKGEVTGDGCPAGYSLVSGGEWNGYCQSDYENTITESGLLVYSCRQTSACWMDSSGNCYYWEDGFDDVIDLDKYQFTNIGNWELVQSPSVPAGYASNTSFDENLGMCYGDDFWRGYSVPVEVTYVGREVVPASSSITYSYMVVLVLK